MATLTTGLLENFIPVVLYHGLNTNQNVTVGGSANVDLSGSTGTFATPTGATTLNGTTTMAAGKALVNGTGGTTPITAPSGVVNTNCFSVTAGTNTTPASGTQFVTSIFLPCNMTITGVSYLVGATGGTDKVYAALYDNSGALLGNSSVSGGGATVGTASQQQTLALTATYAAKGPANFYVGISMNGNTARIATVAAHLQNGIFAGSVSQTHGTVAAITAPTTFTADKAPFIFLY